MRTARLRSALHKLRWGIAVVGPWRSVRGAVRYAQLRIRRPERAVVHLHGSGVSLEFDYPRQCNPALVVFGDYIDPEFAFLAAVMKPDAVVVDVGAAIGQFAMFAARQGAKVVHAFEPSAANCRRLEANAIRNGVDDRVVLHHMALSDNVGEATFGTTASTFVSGLTAASEETEVVRVDTLAHVCDELAIGPIDVLKINVAGYEPAVLRGAEPMLARGGADMLILLIGLESLPIYARLHRCGYRFFFFHSRHQTLHEVDDFEADAFLSSRPSPARNVIAIRAEVVSELIPEQIPVV